MPVYKKKGKAGKASWYAIFYYTDWTGTRKQKKKEGFATQREAKEYERQFLECVAGTPEMTFGALADLYLADLKHNTKETTYINQSGIIENHIRPFFGALKVNEITAATVRKWQNTFAESDYAQGFLFRIHRILSTMFNFAIKYYGLIRNPAVLAGSMGKRKPKEEMRFLTLEEFSRLREVLLANGETIPATAFSFLFLTGCRKGEMLALTASDFDFAAGTVSINKTYTRLGTKDVITTPKTEKSVRTITMPPTLIEIMQNYINGLGNISAKQRIFDCVSANTLRTTLHRYTAMVSLPKIRLHDFRHSHTSLLIEQGISPIAIADRLGHESVQTTLNTYSHLYPGKQKEVADKLQKVLTF